MHVALREALARTDARSVHAVLDLFVTFSIKGKSKEKECTAFNKKRKSGSQIDLFLIIQ